MSAWISVKERMPLEFDARGMKIKLKGSGRILDGCIPQPDGAWWVPGGKTDIFIPPQEVTHWQCLPEPPVQQATPMEQTSKSESEVTDGGD
jgi:hypothetical protein